jgi:hypothetical protein
VVCNSGEFDGTAIQRYSYSTVKVQHFLNDISPLKILLFMRPEIFGASERLNMRIQFAHFPSLLVRTNVKSYSIE